MVLYWHTEFAPKGELRFLKGPLETVGNTIKYTIKYV